MLPLPARPGSAAYGSALGFRGGGLPNALRLEQGCSPSTIISTNLEATVGPINTEQAEPGTASREMTSKLAVVLEE